ncbi:MAG: hypothetical protein WBW94_06485 [Anaerolineales bacterium]
MKNDNNIDDPWLPMIPMIVGGLVWIIFSFIHSGIDPKFSISLGFFLFGCTGIIWAKRREVPHRYAPPYTGITALIISILWTLIFWGMATMSILYGK